MAASSPKNNGVSWLRSLSKTGFFHIFGAGTLNRVLSIILSFVLVRVLTKDAYGVYAYAYNIVSFFILFNGLGIPSAILQICSELYAKTQEADCIYAYAYASGFKIDIVLGILILLTGALVPLEIVGSNQLLMLYCMLPLAMLLFDIKTMRLRVLLMNREYALATNVQSVLMTILTIAGALLFGAVGLIIGQTASYLIAYALLCLKFPFRSTCTHGLSADEKKDFWGVSGLSALNNGLSQVLALTGTFFIGQFIASESMVASYQVATLIPFGLLFVPGMLMTYAYPYFARHKDDRRWTIRGYAKLTVASTLMMGTIALLCGLLAEPIVWLLFGAQYLDIVSIMRMLLIGFFISAAFGKPAGNLLVTQRKLLTNTCVGIITIIVNICASILLIPPFGMEGAALTYIITMTATSLISMACYIHAITNIKMPPEGQTR